MAPNVGRIQFRNSAGLAKPYKGDNTRMARMKKKSFTILRDLARAKKREENWATYSSGKRANGSSYKTLGELAETDRGLFFFL